LDWRFDGLIAFGSSLAADALSVRQHQGISVAQVEWWDRGYCLAWVALGCVFVGAVLLDWSVLLHSPGLEPLIFISIGIGLALVGISHIKRWRFSPTLNLIAGLLCFLYVLAALLFGSEDVGGVKGLIPLVGFIGGLGVWSLVMFATGSSRGAA
jgi:hypothetical protein